MQKTDFKLIIKERGFPLSMRDFGRIVCLSPNRLRIIYVSDENRFYDLLDTAIERWNGICSKVKLEANQRD